MIEKLDGRIVRRRGGTLHLHRRFHTAGPPRPTVIFSHGFTVDGAESHRMFLRMAGRYNALGLNTINFDYYGCGYSDGDYSEFSFSNAVADLSDIIDWAKAQPEADANRMIIHGQSLGTAIATVVGSRRQDIAGYIFWALSADLLRRYKAMLGDDIFRQGYTWIHGKGFKILRSFMDDIAQYDILSYFNSWETPTLFITPGDDTKGEPELAEKANDTIGELGTRIVIEGANHSFKCQPEHEKAAFEASALWVDDLISSLKV